jgi:hypothetical protein
VNACIEALNGGIRQHRAGPRGAAIGVQQTLVDLPHSVIARRQTRSRRRRHAAGMNHRRLGGRTGSPRRGDRWFVRRGSDQRNLLPEGLPAQSHRLHKRRSRGGVPVHEPLPDKAQDVHSEDRQRTRQSSLIKPS